MTYSTSNSFFNRQQISISINTSNLIPVSFKQACHANPGANKKGAGSSLYISIHLFLKFSNTSASDSVLI